MVRPRGALLVGLTVAVVVLLPGSAQAAGASAQPTDPNANSPAGAIYSIPLDTARQDAAPHGHSTNGGGATASGGSSGGGGGTGHTGGGTGHISGGRGAGSSSAGTSSGGAKAFSGRGSGISASAAGRARAATGSGAKSARVLVPGGEPGSLIHSSNGFGSSSVVPGIGSQPTAGLAAVQGDGSGAPVLAIILIALLVTGGAFIGAISWRAAHRGGTAGSA